MASVEQDSKQPSTREQYWRDRILQWQASGQTVRVFCGEHSLSEPSFYSWRRTITLRDQPQPTVEQTDGTIPQPKFRPDKPAVRPTFVPVHVIPPPADTTPPDAAGLELVIGAGRVVRVSPRFDAATLRRLLTVLEEPPSC